MIRLSSSIIAVLGLAIAMPAQAQTARSQPMAAAEAEIAAGERALTDDERQLAESHYRGALYAGWMLAGALATADRRFNDARDAFGRASESIVDSGDALQSLAVVQLQLGDAPAAVAILSKLTAARPSQPALKRLLAQALIAAKQPAEAVQILEEARGAAPDDLETAFALATGYLRLRKPDAARPLFERLAAARPLPETYVLIGRAYRDAGMFAEARVALNRALTRNPRARHANYYLGTAAVMEEGVARIDEAIAAFRRELAIAPGDPAASVLLGIALVEARQEREALPLLEADARRPGASWRTFQYLGRCQLALGRATDAVASLRQAIARSADVPEDSRVGNLHYQLAQALRQSGDAAAAEAEFARASSAAASRADSRRDALQRYLVDETDRPGVEIPTFALESAALATVPAVERQLLRGRNETALARAYMNLGILQVQAGRFARAAGLLQAGARLSPELPQIQYSLGVASFNAGQFAQAVPALERALAAEPGNAQARRMLALASLNIDGFTRAAELLRADPDLNRDASLQYAYGVALVHSGRAAEAEKLFSSLLAAHAESAELNVLLGQAHAEQGDYDGAVASLKRALALKPDIADANRTLGVIHLKKGQLAEAAAALQAEVAAHPGDRRARYTLATVFDLDNQQGKALEQLALLLQQRPDDVDARYLTGKILLARDAPADAVEHLEIASRLAEEDANVQYQLGQAYRKLGRAADAQRAFDRFQQLKDKRRGGGL